MLEKQDSREVEGAKRPADELLGPGGQEITTPEQLHEAIRAAARPDVANAAPAAEGLPSLEQYRPQPPLSSVQISEMERRRGRPLTPEEIKHINGARARGIHHGV